MRIMGGLAALMICALWGHSKASALSMRQEIMHAFASDIRTLAAEMEYRPRDIRDIIEKLSSGELGEFWQEFDRAITVGSCAEQAWRQTAKNYNGFDLLSPQERSLIMETGNSIGKLNVQDSIKALNHWSKQAEKCAEELREQRRNKGAVYQKLGLLGGLAVMLLIV